MGAVLMIMGFFLRLATLFVDDGEARTFFAIVGVMFFMAGAGLLIAYLVWWLIVLGRAQTPGKQIVGIRAVDHSGAPLGWGMMFVREFLVKGLLFSFLYALTLGILFLADNLWPLWADNNQTLHDKVVNTLVVHVPRG